MIGAVTLLCCALAIYLLVSRPFTGRPSDQLTIAIETPYIGEGVTEGTPLVMHGVQLGVVKAKMRLPSGGVRLVSNIRQSAVAGLTDTMQIDYRPINYFGITGINLTPGVGGRLLRDGMNVTAVPRNNSTLQALLFRLGQITASGITPKLISVIDRSVRYTDGLNPLLETMLTTMHTVADVQDVSTEQLLANATGVSVTLPSFTDAVVHSLYRTVDLPGRFSEEEWVAGPQESIRVASTELFGGTGRLVSNYVDNLLPSVDTVKLLTDPIPALLRPDDFADTLVQLRTRYEKMFAGADGQRAVQLRIVLDSLPGVAAPIAAIGGAP